MSRPTQEQMALFELQMSIPLKALTEEQFHGFLRLNFQAKEDFEIKIPPGKNSGGGKCCDLFMTLTMFIHLRGTWD